MVPDENHEMLKLSQDTRKVGGELLRFPLMVSTSYPGRQKKQARLARR